MKSNQQVVDTTNLIKQYNYQSSEEIEEILLQELESLFDKPCLIPIQSQSDQQRSQNPSQQNNVNQIEQNQQQNMQSQQQPIQYKVGYEKDYSNTFLITNPLAVFKVFQKEQFLQLSENSQCILIDRLDDILQKCYHNSLTLTDHIVLSNVTRLNQKEIAQMVAKSKQKQNSHNDEQMEVSQSQRQSNSKQYIPEHDILLLIIQLCLKLSNKKPNSSKKLCDLIRKLTNGKRFLRCHIEYIYQYLKIRCTKLCKSGRNDSALQKLDTSIKILVNMFEQRYEIGPSNYFYFSGFLSGIQVNIKTITHSEFIKDDKNLPVLFNCFFQGQGGFECYFNNRKLYYRMLGRAYTPPSILIIQYNFIAIESNGILIGEFQPKKWYFFATEHEKPSFTRPQFTAIINDKQVTALPLDYPKIDKNARVSLIAVCKNFVGQLSSFMLFKEPVNNSKKLIQMYHNYEFGFYSNQQMTINPAILKEPPVINNYNFLDKTIYDCVEMRDGELMINSGACNSGPKSKLFYTGGLVSFLPLLDLIRAISMYGEQQQMNLEMTFNEFLKLINAVISSKSYSQFEQESPTPFFNILFHLLSKLPSSAVNNQTIQLLAEIRFQIGDSKLQEQFFINLMYSSDFWLNTDNIEVINEYWLFVKAIYSQNPILYNRIFSIQNLIDLMVKISDLKDAGHCCEYHRNTYMMFYQGQIHLQQKVGRSSTIGGIVTRERNSSLALNDENKYCSHGQQNLNSQQALTPSGAGRAVNLLMENQKTLIHQIDKYLAPIAGVLEGVLTSGGNEVLDQIQYIAKSLTVKSSPCFHLQMLKLLKVLLLDSKEGDSQHCASPGDFAAQFLKANGLQILLYLCSNSSFDVKAMCVKLIDVLSSHTSHIKMAIDPDVITYLCNIILPRSMMEFANIREKSQIFKNINVIHDRMLMSGSAEQQNPNQYEIMDEEEGSNQGSSLQNDDSSDLDNHMNQLLRGDGKINYDPRIPAAQKKFGKGLFIEDDENEDDQDNNINQIIKSTDINLNIEKHQQSKTKQQKQPQNAQIKQRISLGQIQDVDNDEEDPFSQQVQKYQPKQQQNQRFQDQDDKEEILLSKPPPSAPKSRSKPTMQFDFDSTESQQQYSEKQKFNQTSKTYIFGKSQIIAEANEEDEELRSDDEETQNLMDESNQLGNFGIIGFKQDKLANKDKKKQFMNTQKLPFGQNKSNQSQRFGMGSQKPKGLELNIEDTEDLMLVKTKSSGNRNTFSGSGGEFKNRGGGAIQFAEFENPHFDEEEKEQSSKNQKTNRNTTFANENVMSKSNLRQPKQFNFGFPDESDEEEENQMNNKIEEDEEEDKLEVLETDDDLMAKFNQLNEKEEGDEYFGNQFFEEKRSKKQDEDYDDFLELQVVGNKKGSSVLVPSSTSNPQGKHQRGRSNQFEGQKTQSPKKKNLFLGGTTGATSDDHPMIDESREITNTVQRNQQPVQPPAQQKKAVISFQKKAKIFTNANNKLNLDTDAINDLYTYGGEKGQIKMTEDEEIINFEAEIEELASLCIASMNRKSPNDPIKYENKVKSTFESKYLGGGTRTDDQQDQANLVLEKKAGNQLGGNLLTNPRSQFMTPQSVRGIKKIEFSMSQEEKNAALEGSKEKINLGGTMGSKGLSTSKALGLKTGFFSNNTIQEELSPASRSSSSKQDLNFGANSSGGDLLQNKNRKSSTNLDQLDPSQIIQKKKKPNQIPHAHMSFNQTQPTHSLLEPIHHANRESQSKKKRSSDDLVLQQQTGIRSRHSQPIDDLFTNAVEEDMQKSTQNDDYTQELENLYTSCLEWIISRAPSSLYENIVIDEVDKIGYQPAIQLLMTLVTYSNNMIRQRAFNDLEMLAKWDSNNGTQIMVHPQFHQWLLELLMPYQDLTSKYQTLQGTSLAVYDIGCKLHTLLLKNACSNSEEEAYKKINFLIRWPMIVQMQVSQGLKERNERDVDVANKLTRVLVNQLLSGLRDETYRVKPQIGKNQPVWQNMIFLVYLVEELVLSSHQKTINVDNLESSRDVNSSLFKWIQKDYLLYNFGSNEKSLWAEWDILEQVFNCVDIIYPEWLIKNDKNSQIPIEQTIFNILEKCSADEFSSIVDVLLHEGSPYKIQQATNQAQYGTQKQSHQSKAKGLLSGVLGGNKSSHQQQPAQEQAPQNQLTNMNSENSFMKILLNLLCIALIQSDTKQMVQMWLERFEKFVKFIMIISETWKSRLVSTIYNNYQKKFTEIITFAFAFLFHEIHNTNNTSTRTNYSTQNTPQLFSQHSNTSSPKDQMFNKLYAQSLKNLMIYYVNIIEYQKIRYTPTQLESHITACRNIQQTVFIRNYQGTYESLITMKDISRIKQSDYDDFPECFYMEDWKVTFFYSENIKKVIKKQINHQQLLSYMQKKKSYSQHYLDTQQSNDKTKDEILKRMQLDTIEVIGQLSAEEFERKNKVALMNENFIREQGHFWKKTKKHMFGSRGVWRSNILGEKSFLKVNFYRGYDGVKHIMDEKHHNGFEFYDNETDLEKKIFMEQISDPNLELFSIDKKQKITKSILEQKKNQQLRSDDKQMTYSDEDEEKEDDEEDFSHPNIEAASHPIISFFSRILTTREKISLKKQFINHLKEYIFTFRVKTKEILTDIKCSILKPFYQRPGTITITSHDIIFFDDLFTPANLLNERDNIFFFKYQKKPYDLLYKIIPLPNLKEIQRRRFLGRRTGLEIFLMDSKSIILNFQTQDDREQFAKKIIRQRNSKSFNLRYYDTLEPKRILKKRELTEKWMQWKISNFDYIMQLNQLAGRSFNDLSQYPVFPWIITDNISQNQPDIQGYQVNNQPAGSQPPPSGFRDLNKNMQLLGTAERQAEFKRKYDDIDSFASIKEKFHCGSHYSNPGIVLHYMSRLSPFIDALVELHGKNLDTPDRGFHSIQDSLNSALTDHADVRELIPEFYFCPELFLNLNKIKFGIKQDSVEVNDIILPQWCNNDPYIYVIFLREAFESNYVSQNLCSWIDYIFGYKQRDAEAEKCLNLFSHLTYEDGVDIDSINDQLLKQSYQEQIYNYGQTPSQLFQKSKHPQRLPRAQALKFNQIADNQSKIKVYKPVAQQQSRSSQANPTQGAPILLSQEAILKAKFVDDQTIIGLSKDGTVTYFFWLSKAHELNPHTPFTCCEDKKRKFDNRQKYNGFEIYDRSIKKFDFPLLVLNAQKCIMRGGFWGGKIQICPIEGMSSEQQSSLTAHQSTVTAIVAAQNEKLVITGSKSGDIIVWQYIGGSGNPSHESNWQIRKQFSDHEGIISTIHINEEMCLYLTCSFDGTANIYNLWNDKFFRCFQHPKLAPIHSGILTQAPLSACCFFSREDHHWYSFTLNGHFIEKQREESSHIISPQVVKDSHFMEKLIYGTEKGFLIFRQLPLLKQYKKQQVSTQYPVLSIIVSPDRRFLLVGCGDGGLNVVTEPFQISQSTNQIQSSSTVSGVSSVLIQSTVSTQMNQSIASSFISVSQSTVGSQSMAPIIAQQNQSLQGKMSLNNNHLSGSSYSSNQSQAQNNQQHQYRE